MTNQRARESRATAFDLIGLISAGSATVTVAGRPFLRLDCEGKSVELETDGAKEAGLRLSTVVRVEGTGTGASTLRGSAHIANALARQGWRLILYAEGHKVLTMGAGVSRATGRISVSPLGLRRLLDVLR